MSWDIPRHHLQVANETAYVHRGWGEQDSEQRKKENVDFVVNAVAALEQACPKLQFLTFPTGGKVSILATTESIPSLTSSNSGTDLNTAKKWKELCLSKKMHRASHHLTVTIFSTTHRLIHWQSWQRERAGILQISDQTQLC